MFYNYGIINQNSYYNKFMPIGNIINIYQSTVKIRLESGNLGSGFFIKFPRNDTIFRCLMTNNHLIKEKCVLKKEKIIVYYNNQINNKEIILDRTDRIIECFKKDGSLIDITIVEIIPKDKIEEGYFLSPNPLVYNYHNYHNLIGSSIEVMQYPYGEVLSRSKGRILETFYEHLFAHDSSTANGSSGSPIVLKGENTVIAIHQGVIKDYPKKVGIFIGIVLNEIKKYRRNGKGKEYYPNGNLKYEGNFLNDKYDDNNGFFIFENGNQYIGQFKNGKRNGSGYIVDKNNNLILSGFFENDELIFKYDDNINTQNSKAEYIANGIVDAGKKVVNNIKYGITYGIKHLIGERCEVCNHLKSSHVQKDNKLICYECPLGKDVCYY